MKTSILIALLLLISFAALAQNTVTVATDKAKYFPTDTIIVTVTYWNFSDTTTLLTFSSTCQFNFCVDTTWCRGSFTSCGLIVTSVSIPPFSTHVWTQEINASELTLGNHALTGWIGEMDSTIRNYGTGSTTFNVRVNEVTISTDRSNYFPGDTIAVSTTYWNNTDTTTSLEFRSSCQHNFTIDSWCWGCYFGCAAVMTYVEVPPHSSHTWTNHVALSLDFGEHTVVGWVGGLDSTRFVHGMGRTTFTVDSTYTVSFVVSDGWNMMSYPLIPDAPATHSDFPGSASRVFEFNRGYKTSEYLQYGNGYWLKFTGTRTITLSGHPLLIDTIDVTPGWKMIGSLSVPIQRSSILAIPSGIISTQREFNYYGGNGYALDTLMRPGKAYWMKVNGAGKIILDGRGQNK
jgi:hypothetical protein